jgi:beta-lactam-binding protein with PASTA domain
VSFIKQALTVLKRILIVVGIAIAFTIGLIGAIILSLYSSQTKVPDIVGKDRATAEDVISAARLNFRVRAIRPVSDSKPNTVLIQIPSAGQEVKVGQTVAVDISRPTKEGEAVTPANTNANNESDNKQENSNANSASDSNDNTRKRKPKNKNGNDNQNGNSNANGSANRNRNSNTNRANANANVNATSKPAGTPAHTNLNSNRGENTNRVNTNGNRPRPAATP